MKDDSQRTRFERRWRSRFAEFASLRDDDAGIAGWSTTGLETRFRFFTNLWRNAPAGAQFMDVGCGAGTYSRWLADAGLRVIGVDYSQPALTKARQRDAVRITYCAADASRLPFATGSMDGVLCFGVLQAVWNSEPIVIELARVLKPGGELWIDALNSTGIRAIWDRAERRIRGKPMHLRYESSRTLMGTIRRAGFVDLSLHWLPIMPAGLHRLQRMCETKIMRSLMDAVLLVGATTSHSFVVRARREDPQNADDSP